MRGLTRLTLVQEVEDEDREIEEAKVNKDSRIEELEDEDEDEKPEDRKTKNIEEKEVTNEELNKMKPIWTRNPDLQISPTRNTLHSTSRSLTTGRITSLSSTFLLKAGSKSSQIKPFSSFISGKRVYTFFVVDYSCSLKCPL